MSLNQGKFKPSIAAIDEVDDRNLKADELHKQQIEGSETAPLTNNQHKLHLVDNLAGKDIESQQDGRTRNSQGSATTASNGNGSVNGLRGRLSIDALMRLSRKRRILYISTACLCAVLLVIIIMLIAFWPEVPFYLKAELCLEKECVEAGRQVLLWANTSKSPCHETYEWACGNFANEYAENDYFVIKRGEWNYKTYNEYQELNELNRFISMLPRTSYSVESMISSLYRTCIEIDTLDKSQSDLMLKKAIKSVDGWQAFREPNQLQNWEYKKALVRLQVLYGIFPYYKVSVQNRNSEPYDYIIALDEGDIGLPDKYFYSIDQNDEIVKGYKQLLVDFAINMGIVSSEAKRFADEIFHYEERIVNHIELMKGEHHKKEIKTLLELKTIAPSLPILESLQTIFPHTKITEETEVLVYDTRILGEISTVISSSDPKNLNNFIVWSLVRNMLPHLSKEYRVLVENFDNTIYGRTASYPRWMVCTKFVRDWLPFAVESLQETQRTELLHRHMKLKNLLSKTEANDEVLRLMFYALRNQLQTSIDQAAWMDVEFKNFVRKKLTEIRLQIGIPEEVLTDKKYVQNYYNELMLNNLFFVEHNEAIWSFRKSCMEEKLKPQTVVDTIISELYSREDPQNVAYSNLLNMVIISRGIVVSEYYDYRYPVPVNFARIGADILEVLIESLSTFETQFNGNKLKSNDSSVLFELPEVDLACIVADEQDQTDLSELSENALKSFRITLSAAKIAAKALSNFVEAIDSSSPIMGASINQHWNYENLRLTQRHRIAGLRSYNENELFSLAYMQKHCSTSIADKDYASIKPHVEHRLAERYLFDATWNHIQFLKLSSSCSVPEVRCSNIL